MSCKPGPKSTGSNSATAAVNADDERHVDEGMTTTFGVVMEADVAENEYLLRAFRRARALGDSEVLVNSLLLESSRQSVESGGGDSLLRELFFFCALSVSSPIEMPPWMAIRVGKALHEYTSDEVRTLDIAFGVTRPKKYRARSAREERRPGLAIYADVTTMHKAGAALDDALFEAVGQEHGVGKTTARKWYYHHKRKRSPAISFKQREQQLLERISALVNWRSSGSDPVAGVAANSKKSRQDREIVDE